METKDKKNLSLPPKKDTQANPLGLVRIPL